MSRCRGGWLIAVVGLLASPGQAFDWDRSTIGCEPPEIFYSAAHDPAIAEPCCDRNPERCPGGVACVAGSCAAPYGSYACTPPAAVDAPNFVFLLLDDQGWCQYGFMGPECRTQKYGATIPSPPTPNLDKLVLQPDSQGRGRFFEVNYSNAGWSLPAREGLQMGLYRKDILDPNVPDRYVADLLTQDDGPVYCTFAAGGKVGGAKSTSLIGYRGENRGRKWGRYHCEPAPCFPNCDDPPLCGPDIPDNTPENVLDVFKFVETTLVGPRDAGGNLMPGQTYTQSQPFFVFISSALPHKPWKPPVAIEDRNGIFESYLFGQSFANPGQPRFPFAAPQYAFAFAKTIERKMPGVYGNVYWADDAVRHVRNVLENIQVWDHTGLAAVSLWERTVFLATADHGENLVRAKRNFTQNGYRSPLVIHDARLAPSAAEGRISAELTHAIDVLPTMLDFAEHPIPPSNGKSLRDYLTPTPPVAPLRNLLCGHEVKGTKAKPNRYARVRAGAIGRCAPVAGTACATDAACAPGLCLTGTCGTGTQCLEDDDCGIGETCQHQGQKWCRFGHHPLDEPNVPPPNLQPTVACTTDADCAADCPSGDPLYCTCEHRELVLYSLLTRETKLIDVFVDPDEPGINKKLAKFGPHPDEIPIGAGAPHEHLGERLKCCLDQWWTPPPAKSGPLGDPTCTTCDPQYRCHDCGDGIVNSTEECDGTNLNGATCAGEGFGGGTLACTGSCTFDTGGCTP